MSSADRDLALTWQAALAAAGFEGSVARNLHSTLPRAADPCVGQVRTSDTQAARRATAWSPHRSYAAALLWTSLAAAPWPAADAG